MTGHSTDPLQFAYKKHNSYESAMLTIFDIVFTAANNGEVALLTLLELTAAFDAIVISHPLLIDCLSKAGLLGDYKAWFTNYISDWKTSSLLHGVPKGSVLGSILFSLYILGLGEICQRYSIQYVLYM